MELKDIRAAIAVAEAGRVRAAARALGTEQSALSRRIAALEDEIGVSLFQRSRGGTTLTAAGSRFLDQVRLALSQIETAVTDAQTAGQAAAGRVRIGITASIASGFVRDLLAAWRQHHPDVAIDLVEAAPGDHAAALRAHELDLSFQLSTIPAADLDSEWMWTDRVLAAVPASHPVAGQPSCRIADLAGAPFIVGAGGSGPDIRDFLTTRLYRLGDSPAIRRLDLGREALLCCVGLGLGLTITTGADAAIAYPGVRFVELEGEQLPFSAFWSPRNDNPALRRFLSTARQARLIARPNLDAPPRPRDTSTS